jgi:hypothetical protein
MTKCLLVLVLLAVQVAGADRVAGQDHLRVPDSALSSFKFHVDYEHAVRQTLLSQRADDCYLRLIAMPSFQPEWMVEVSEPAGGVAKVQLVVANRPVSNAGKPTTQSTRTSVATLSPETAAA